jgi:ribosome-binding factor A
MNNWNPKSTLDSIGIGKREKKRPSRIAEAVRNELSVVLLQKMRDPAVASISVTRVQVTDDLKYAKIYYRVMGDKKSAQQAGKGLERAKGFLRTQLAKSLNLRYTPALQFYYDETADKVEEVEQLLREIAKEEKSNEDS